MGDWTLRRARAGDEAALALVGAATFLDAYAGVLPGDEILLHCAREHVGEKYRALLADADAAAWLVEDGTGGAPVGYLTMTRPDLPVAGVTAADAEVKGIYLLSRYQGRGAARAMMEAARREARARGKERLLLGVYRKNVRALRFYGRCGFVEIGERRFLVGKQEYEDAVLALDTKPEVPPGP